MDGIVSGKIISGCPVIWADRKIVWIYPIITLAVIVVVAMDGESMAPLGLIFAAMLFYQMLRTLAIGYRRADRRPPWFMPILIFGVIGLVLFLSLT